MCVTPFALCWMPADAAARCPPCEQVLPALGVILLCPLFLLCRVRALLGVCLRVTDAATMAYSEDDSRCALGTHPHTLPCPTVGVIAAGEWSMAAAARVLERDEVPNEQKRPHPLDEITMADESNFYGLLSTSSEVRRVAA
ncbi:hypothetical protein TCDM_12596 [Trypanosoma cruzi Dm28c]|uniref:Uncharacterized protein n=1 Tax=Trypanosoma cruzi Dm28c TaxID=1416333 RepID=V5CKK2_TRYCR|nr:hypothetical protein TCDM_12596 [Trypanosoma cruzi Dm28c]